MKFVFGPVPSKRLGQSLGIDPIPLKTCNWNCVYCQLGRTRPVILERSNWVDPATILVQVRDALRDHGPGEIDWVTFVGSGEPALHLGLGDMIREIKCLTDIPVAVITNGSLLYLAEVREAMLAADAVLPTLDAGNAELYRRINRPHPESTYERLLEGLLAFRERYTGKLWPEVMLVHGLNDTEEALKELAERFRALQPDEVHLNVPTRPPAEVWVEPPDEEGMMRARAILGGIARVLHPAEGSFDLSGYEDVHDAIVGVITRHPMREEELERALAMWDSEAVAQALSELEASNRAQVVERFGVRFWSAAPAYYPGEGQSRASDPTRRKGRDAE